MVIKVYTSGISGNKEVKKKQQRIMMILESKNYEYVTIDITEPGNEEEKFFMQENAKPKPFEKHPIPPQIFNESEYCGDYEGFDVANENDELEVFLKMPLPPPPPVVNGNHEIEEENVHGFCYTPGLAKRLEKALKNRMRKAKPNVKGYCYTPSLAQRLAKALEKALTRKHPGFKLNDVNEDEKKEQEDETESLEHEEMDAEEEDENKEEEVEDENKNSDEDIEEEE